MSKFVILDHFLESTSGHNYQYNVELLRAAARRGWQGILVASRRLPERPELAAECRLYRSFQIADPDYKLILRLNRVERKLAGTQKSTRKLIFIRKTRYRVKRWYYQRQFEASLARYGTALSAVQSGCSLAEGDRVVVPTTMLLDVAGIAAWVRKNPLARQIQWHLNFHFPLVNIETWYSRSCRQYGKFLILWPQLLARLREALPPERLHLHTTSAALADQLQYFLNETFQVLPYPVDPALVSARADDAVGMLCGESSRADRGRELMQASR